ncbi:hypothetical protein B0H19DRAFT_1078885 [Mycena capillaripes]|nr:hypothetical protein B0H19DRAFT_1078885 [Mycena capillaripes]
MDQTLHMPEIQDKIFAHLDPGDFIGPTRPALKSLAALARTCKSFQRPALDALWRLQTDLLPAFQCFPDDVWDVGPSHLGKKTFLKFRRPLQPADWERPLIYWRLIKSFRIFGFDKARISPDVCETLRSCCPTPSLFPNLREVGWFERDPSLLPLFSMFLSPQIKSIGLVPMDSPEHISLLPTLGVKYPNLTHVDLGGQPYTAFSARILESVSTFVLNLHHLESLGLSQANGAIFDHLAQLPFLKSLVVDSVVPFKTSFLRNSSDPRFPSLRALNLWATTPEIAAVIVGAMEHPALTSLNLVFNAAFPNAQTTTKLYTVIARNRDHSALRYLRVEDDGAHSFAKAPSDAQFGAYVVHTETLTILFAFTNLTTIILKPFHGFDLDDEMMSRMARTWYRVEELRLTGHHRVREAPARVTLMGIYSLARHCVNLRVLEIFFDASNIPMLDEIRPQTSLTILGTNESPISSPAAVAIFLSSIFPGLQDIDVAGFGPSVNSPTRRLWDKVDRFLKAGTAFAHDDGDENE